jgi:hypothetical protein
LSETGSRIKRSEMAANSRVEQCADTAGWLLLLDDERWSTRDVRRVARINGAAMAHS